MKLSVSHNFAFLCNPKCGSTSIEKAIAKYCRVSFGGHPTLKHINAKTYHRHVVPMLEKAGVNEKIETFCIMREPVERIFSWYRYQMRPLLANPEHHAHAKYTGHMTFEEFVLGYISDDKPIHSSKIGKQADFITLQDGTVGVDRVFPLEDMSAVEEFLSTKIGKKIRIPHRNVSPVEKPVANHKAPSGIFSIFGSKSKSAAPAARAAAASESPKKMDMNISAELLGRLKEFLEDDYRIYRKIIRP